VVKGGRVRLGFIHGIRVTDTCGLLQGEGASKRFVPSGAVADAVVGVVPRQQAQRLAGEVELEGVAEGLGEEQDALAVEREVGALAEEGEPGDVRRQALVGQLACRRPRLGGEQPGQREKGAEPHRFVALLHHAPPGTW
jgi:hypothetical protein